MKARSGPPMRWETHRRLQAVACDLVLSADGAVRKDERVIQSRRFGPELKAPVPRPGCRGLSARVIQLPEEVIGQLGPEEASRRYDGMPIVVARSNSVVALYLDAHGEMDEHDAPEPILFMVTGGRGFVRVGGPRGETLEVEEGDAVLWPANTLHKAWTEEEPLEAIVIHYSQEQSEHTARAQ